MATVEERRQAGALRLKWEHAYERVHDKLPDDDWPALSAEEQRTYDELIDYIEATGLNYSAYDPR